MDNTCVPDGTKGRPAERTTVLVGSLVNVTVCIIPSLHHALFALLYLFFLLSLLFFFAAVSKWERMHIGNTYLIHIPINFASLFNYTSVGRASDSQ